MKTIVFAYHNMGCIGIEKLIENGFEILAVFTHKDDSSENKWFNSVAELAAKNHIPVFAPDDVHHSIWIDKIKSLKPEIIFSFYYRKMLKKEVLNLAPKGALNLHGSLLPKYRGRCPVNWVLINGEKETGVTLHYMTPKPDDGDITASKAVKIEDYDTAFTLFNKLTDSAKTLLSEILPKIKNGTATRTPQEHSKATYFGGRRPENGLIDWSKSAAEIRNLIRATTTPYPGAFTYLNEKKIIIWGATVENSTTNEIPGTIISLTPLKVACGKNTLVLDFIQEHNGVYLSGEQASSELGLVEKMRLGKISCHHISVEKPTRVLILGVNGFIGNALSERLLENSKFEVHGMDLYNDKITRLMNRKGFHFEEGDISINREWIEYHVRKCDIILPLVAIATPKEYVRNPLRVFSLDFEENLRIVRYCAKYGKRIIFPSTSEVYGMCTDEEFDEDKSNFILGPIQMQRWIYSCSKQLLDRVIWAYGQQEGLKFNLFRPFNWIGPRLDSLDSARIGSSRVITQLILNLVEGTPILLVDGGRQKRCFTDVKDGVECLYQIISNKTPEVNGQIFNIGNPDNDLSIKDLALTLVKKFENHPHRSYFPPFCGIREIESSQYYGSGYQDVEYRKPSIKKAQKILNWTPKVGFEESLDQTLDFFMQETVQRIKENK